MANVVAWTNGERRHEYLAYLEKPTGYALVGFRFLEERMNWRPSSTYSSHTVTFDHYKPHRHRSISPMWELVLPPTVTHFTAMRD
jgi:hypothetical protein